MNPFKLLAAAALGAIVLAGTAGAGPEKIQYPANYRTAFVVYNEVERPDRKPAQIRFMYANREAVDAARSGQAVPHGTVLIMEDRIARLDDKGEPVRGADGRFVATDQIANIFAMEKRPGWGAEYPPAKRNGEWEYAWFNADGSVRQNANFDGCFTCHLSRADKDYNFTFSKWVIDGKPRAK